MDAQEVISKIPVPDEVARDGHAQILFVNITLSVFFLSESTKDFFKLRTEAYTSSLGLLTDLLTTDSLTHLSA